MTADNFPVYQTNLVGGIYQETKLSLKYKKTLGQHYKAMHYRITNYINRLHKVLITLKKSPLA